MTFWDWFSRNGDRVFAFLALAPYALKGVDGVPPALLTAVTVTALLATIAHQTFFPNSPQEKPK